MIGTPKQVLFWIIMHFATKHDPRLYTEASNLLVMIEKMTDEEKAKAVNELLLKHFEPVS